MRSTETKERLQKAEIIMLMIISGISLEASARLDVIIRRINLIHKIYINNFEAVINNGKNNKNISMLSYKKMNMQVSNEAFPKRVNKGFDQYPYFIPGPDADSRKMKFPK